MGLQQAGRGTRGKRRRERGAVGADDSTDVGRIDRAGVPTDGEDFRLEPSVRSRTVGAERRRLPRRRHRTDRDAVERVGRRRQVPGQRIRVVAVVAGALEHV